MTQAHKMVKTLIAKLSSAARYNGQYAEMLKLALKESHKEFKAMQAKEANPYTVMIDDCKARIVELESIEQRDGYIVVIGENIRLPVQENSNGWTKVENASVFWYIEDARRLAVRVTNGNGEKGQVVLKADQIKWEIEQQRELLATLENFVANQ